MENILSFAQKNLKTFEEMPFCEVDSLILSWLSYLKLEATPVLVDRIAGIKLIDVYRAEIFNELVDLPFSEQETLQLLAIALSSPRYRDMKVRYYEEDFNPALSKQFAAMVFELMPGLNYVAFRGTDSTIVGWKEDFELSKLAHTPSQIQAVEYLNWIMPQLTGTIYVGGHSKGGHLAVFASAFCKEELQERITLIFSHDGPGFLDKDLEYPGFTRIYDRICKTIPKSSLIGVIFSMESPYKVVESNGSGLMQHNPFTWEVEGDHLLCRPELKITAELIRRRFNNWVNQFSQEERTLFIEGVFGVLEEAGIKSVRELITNPAKYIPRIFKSIKKMEKNQRQFIFYALRLLAFGTKRHTTPEDFGLDGDVDENEAFIEAELKSNGH